VKILLLVGLALAAQEPSPSPSPTIRVRLSPQVGHAPVSVRLTATVTDEGRTLSCPGFSVEWGDGCKSAAIPLDCDPYVLVDERPTRWSLPPLTHRYHQGGSYTVKVDVYSAGEKALGGSVGLEVIGPQPLTEARAR
jgi:hypothetical protein